MMKSKDIIAEDSENEFEVDEPEEVGDHSDDDDWNPSATTKTPAKRGRPARSTPGKRKKAKVADDDDEDEDEVLPAKSTPGRRKKVKVADDEEEEEILPKKIRGAKPKTPTTAAKGRGRAAKGKSKKEEEPEEEEDFDEDDDVEEDEIEDEEDMDEEEEEEEEELNQGPNAKPAKKFTSGAFVVLKTDMIGDGNPPVWKIDGKALLQKYIPFKQDGKTLYKNTSVYSGWGSNVKEQYYSAPVSFIQQTRKEHIIEFFKDKIKKDPKVEEAAKKELEDEVAGAEDDDDDEDEDEEDEKAEQDEA